MSPQISNSVKSQDYCEGRFLIRIVSAGNIFPGSYGLNGYDLSFQVLSNHACDLLSKKTLVHFSVRLQPKLGHGNKYAFCGGKCNIFEM